MYVTFEVESSTSIHWCSLLNSDQLFEIEDWKTSSVAGVDFVFAENSPYSENRYTLKLNIDHILNTILILLVTSVVTSER